MLADTLHASNGRLSLYRDVHRGHRRSVETINAYVALDLRVADHVPIDPSPVDPSQCSFAGTEHRGNRFRALERVEKNRRL